MTYARRRVDEFLSWTNLDVRRDAEALIRTVLEDAAREADRGSCWTVPCDDSLCRHQRDSATRIRALADREEP